jgi:hypothetical protein
MATGTGNGSDMVLGDLVIMPLDQTLPVTVGGTVPTLSFTASVNGASVAPAWTVDRGEIGTIDVSSGVFTPTGAVGGKATVTADYQGLKASTSVTVTLSQSQNGDPVSTMPPPVGASGPGGVGGDGPAPGADPGQVTVLNGKPTADDNVHILYPYHDTVWPRGLWAPLIQWDPGKARTFDAVLIKLHSNSFDYTGTFKQQQPAKPFMNIPLPQLVWHTLTYSNGGGGDDITVTLVFEDISGGKGNEVAVGPYTMTWHVAPGTLKGTVYYISYGTGLIKDGNGNPAGNSGEPSCAGPIAGECCNVLSCVDKAGNSTFHRSGPAFGGATLAIKPGVGDPTKQVPDPAVIAGTQTPDATGCRVCHELSANGRMLLTQRSNNHNDESQYDVSATYDLVAATKATQDVTVTPPSGTNQFTFSALAPDGTWFISDSGGMRNADDQSRAYNIDGSLKTPAPTNLPAGWQASLPTFSPDGAHLAYNDWTGGGNTNTLKVIDYDAMTNAFGTPKQLYKAGAGTAAWSSFLPTNDAVVFEHEIHGGKDPDEKGGNEYGYTRGYNGKGAQGELMWVDTATATSFTLDRANGKGYLPTFGTNHTGAGDAQLNFEPTVNPVVSGGYAWIVFTSRRSYGNVATIDPYSSDPRQYDWRHSNTTKKLWVAAIDLNAKPGSDPSHPAFYLPAQELIAGNARGFWAVDPCHDDGQSCESGDECCGGYCRPGSSGGGLVCTKEQPMCAQEFEKCTKNEDCCGYGTPTGGLQCINGRCSKDVPIS